MSQADSITSKVCAACRAEKSLREFYRNTDGSWFGKCKACVKARALARYHENKPPPKPLLVLSEEERRERRRARNRKKCRRRYARLRQSPGFMPQKQTPDQNRVFHLRSRYRLTHGDYLSLLDAQGYVCAICRSPRTGIRKRKHFAVDHDHSSNAVRGLLCNRCNTTLGLAGDNLSGIMRYVRYLEKQGYESHGSGI
jgi:hypothetical protein